MTVYDTHVHLFSHNTLPDTILKAYMEPMMALNEVMDLGTDNFLDWFFLNVRGEELVPHMKEAKVDKAVILPLDFGLLGKTKETVEQYNDFVFETGQRYPEALIPFIGVDPQRGAEALRLVNKYVKQFDARGVKVYPSTGWYPAEERIKPFWDLVDDLGLIVVTHAGASWGSMDEKYNHPEHFAPVLERYHDLKLVMAHLGGKYYGELFPLLKAHDNAYTDISALQGWLPSSPEIVLSRLREVMDNIPQKAFFASDWPLFDLSYPYVSWVEFVKERPWGTDEEKEKLFGGNFQRVLGH